MLLGIGSNNNMMMGQIADRDDNDDVVSGETMSNENSGHYHNILDKHMLQ